jgi:acyl transferase domain-containing protein/acyl carrier protein
VDGVDAIRPVPESHWSAADYLDPDPKTPDKVYAARGGFLDPVPFPPGEFGIAPTNLEATDSSQLLGLIAAQQALEDCGYAVHPSAGQKPVDRNRVSVILGVTGTLQLVIPLGARLGHPLWRKALREAGVDDTTAEDVVQRIADGYVPWQENSFPGLLGNVVAGRIANRLDLGGTNCVVDAACASSLGAVHLAGMELATGRADLVLTGGVDCFNDIFMFTCFSKTPALSPTGNARPFDAQGDGTVLGEGLGVVVLKRLEDARRDGDRIYAVLRGIGSSSDGKGGAIYAPRREGQMEALRNAYRAAGVSPATVELVEAHGTGTKVGDATEISALADVYREAGREGTWCAVGSIKSQIGHTKAAAGAAGLIKAALALYHKVIPPTIKITQPLEVLRNGPLYPNTQRRPWMPNPNHPRRAALSAFGFGGSNFHCVLEEADPAKPEIDWCGDGELWAFSGTEAEVRQQIDHASDAEASRRAFRVEAPVRVLIACPRSQWAAKREQAKALREGDGVFVGRGPAGKLGIVFPGQGAQYVGMLREWVCHFPTAFDTFCRADARFSAATGRRLVDAVFPFPAFDEETRQKQEADLRATDVAQPALGAVQLAAWRVLQYFGVQGDAFAGHSYGELVALCAAGRLAEEELHLLSLERGRRMAEAGSGESGSMLAVKASETALAAILAEEGLDLTLANKNAPEQTVLSGARAAIDRAREALSRRKIACTVLPVAAAFHSPLVAGAQQPFAAVVAGVRFSAGAPVYANSTAEPYPEDGRSLLAAQLARPVEWVRSLQAMQRGGITDFLEVGAAGRLTPLNQATLPQAGCFAVDRKAGMRDVAATLAWLASRGYTVDLTRWNPTEAKPPKKTGMTVPISGINYVKPREPRPPRVAKSPEVRATPRPAPPSAPAEAPISINLSNQNSLHNKTATPTMTPPDPLPTANPAPVPAVDASALAQALALTRESLHALQRMQEQQAALHRQFLDGQDAAQRTMAALIDQQSRLLGGGGITWPASPSPAIQPAPMPMPTPLPLSAPQPAKGEDRAPMASAPPVMVQAPTPASVPKQTATPGTIAAAPRVAPVAPVATPPAAAPVAPAVGATKVLLEVIAEKTGYAPGDLELGMSLDADLGIDSIKRVEILSALQERLPDAPPVKPEHLGTLHTLGDIAAFLSGPVQGTAAPIPVAPSTGTTTGSAEATATLLTVIAEKTGYAPGDLELGMSLDADLGIDSIKRVEILSALQERLPDAPPVKPEHLGTLHTLADIAAFLSGPGEVARAHPNSAAQPVTQSAVPAASQPTLERGVVRPVPLTAPRSSRPLHGSLRAVGDTQGLTLPSEGPLAGLLIVAPPVVEESFLRQALFAVQEAGPMLRANHGLLMTVSRMDGAFGLAEGATRCPLAGALAGLAKTASLEWPEVTCRAIDLAPELPLSVLEEEWGQDGPVEVGLSRRGAITLTYEHILAESGSFVPFRPGDLVIVSGGARGVTAEAAFALARRFRPTLLLLGRSPEPTPEPDWLAALPDEPALKRELPRRLNLPLRQVGEQVKAILAAREIRQNLERLRQMGARAVYRSVDIRDAVAVAAALEGARGEFGPVRGLIHGAGVLADALIASKKPEQFDRVWATKVGGLQSLLQATAQDDLRAVVLFSSSTARFGRVGQVDYAMANEALNKYTGAIAAERPQCRVVALNWGPWAGGMVTPGLAELFAKEGVGLIPLEAGAELLATELTHGPSGPREIVVLAHGSARPTTPPPPTPPMAFERQLTVDDHPVLADHVLDGKPVLPFALMLEWLAHAALVQNPGLTFHGAEELRVLKGVILDGSDIRLRVAAGKASKRGGLFVVATEIRSTRQGKEILHARGEVLLTNTLPPPPDALHAPMVSKYVHAPYEGELLFHGPLLHAIRRVEGMGPEGLVVTFAPAAPPAEWMRRPLRNSWITEPLAVDGVFQAMILWTRQEHGVASLPTFLKSYRQYSRRFPATGCRAIGRTHDNRADVDLIDETGAVVARIEGYEYVMDASLNRAFSRNRIAAG